MNAYVATAQLHTIDSEGWSCSTQLPALEFTSANDDAAERRAYKHYLLTAHKAFPQNIVECRLYVDVQPL